jgi:hypothetical protein
VKSKAQRQAESLASLLDQPRRMAERASEEARYHAAAYHDVTGALERLGIDPDRLREWLAGPAS